MKTPTVNFSLLFCLWTALLLIAAPWAHAEKADRDKPINLEADTATVDDAKKISIYEGNVILTQGTLQIRANKLVVTEDAEGFQLGTAYGNPASFRQKREGYDEYIEGYGLRIEYDQKKDLVQLFNQARMKRDQDEAHGNYISYDGKTEFFQVIGGKETATAEQPARTGAHGDTAEEENRRASRRTCLAETRRKHRQSTRRVESAES